MELTFGDLVTSAIFVFGLISIALVLSEQISRIIYVWLWRIRHE